ncbi:MAG: type IV pilus biogenesis protein PilM, type IV pilus assembly protein PilM [Candidatus Gottesmanbacteria bacterium GW2011_GWA2_43_14]|uniref:Type IV pilus biogenesis protein PilM, type IV pilus assembly protein PilM n=1 Tax=Candidatus Gottesmanbacteria bacterium GW2011_GWA2_43_14 TaxID=1618443 RepID=A0A0G1FTP9_9BACT|nr:MAG: type IV pilus biogenesis protein PilM, type IV pilus assembly protein PilM [Candidatus Gottesmanbacteria bacterium GW2011_GWA2_43_14]
MAKILLGLDIGSHTIKAVQLSRSKNNVSLLSAGYILTPKVEIDMVGRTDEQIMAKAINQLVSDMKVNSADVAASLPSYKVITQVIEIPEMNEKEIEQSIQWEAEQYIPLPLSKVKLDYSVIGKSESNSKLKIILVAAPITLIEKYMRIINLAGLNPVALETEIISSARSVVHSLPTLPNLLLVSIGSNNTDIALIRNHLMIFTRTYPLGGNTLTRAISEELGFDFAQAEEYKNTYGMDESKLEGKIYKIVTPFFNNIFTEMEKNIAYFKEEYPKEELMTVVILGGTAKMPGLMLSTTKNIGINSQISNPFINIQANEEILNSLTADSPIYTTAVGLALKEL